jgi:hypothetical protein
MRRPDAALEEKALRGEAMKVVTIGAELTQVTREVGRRGMGERTWFAFDEAWGSPAGE